MYSIIRRTFTSSFKRGLRRQKIIRSPRIANKKFYSVIRYGQPHPSTHPHILRENEITPLVTHEEYKSRRSELFNTLPESSIAVITSATLLNMTNDIPYPFRQNSNFYYLTGFDEPDSILVLEKDKDGNEISHLFCRPYDLEKIKWDGPMTGVERAPEAFSIDYSYPISKISQFLQSKVTDEVRLFACLDPYADSSFMTPYKNRMTDITVSIEGLRLIKSRSEISLLKRSCDISAMAFIEVMKSLKEGMNEWEVEARLEYECRIRGSKRLAYPPVVASGISANTLHYIKNDMIMKNGQLLLIDAGGEFFNYSSDITRTIPVSGVFTEAQKDIYNAVLRVQKCCISFCRTHVEGQSLSLAKLHFLSELWFREELKELNLLKDDDDLKRFYPHAIGHYLGMDVHDTCNISQHEPFTPGMVITVEPGLYIPEDDDIPEKYRGIGIRIEDNVLITSGDPIVLTENTPKEIEEIEQIMAKK